eukprot:357241-Chlamydomonas_euryale.AAC.18
MATEVMPPRLLREASKWDPSSELARRDRASHMRISCCQWSVPKSCRSKRVDVNIVMCHSAAADLKFSLRALEF